MIKDIIITTTISTIISIITSRYYYERSIIIPAIRYWGNKPILRVKNYGMSSGRNMTILGYLDGKLFLNNKINAIEPSYEKVWIFHDDIQQYKKIIIIILKSYILPSIFLFNTKREINESLLDSVVKQNDEKTK